MVLKRPSGSEVAALRALAVVVGVDRPKLIAAGRDQAGEWLLIPAYGGSPVADSAELPYGVWDTLGRIHAHLLRRRPRGLAVTDATWWRALAEQRIAPALVRAGDRWADPTYACAARAVES